MAIDNFPYARLGLNKTLAEVRADMFSRLDAVHSEYIGQGHLASALNLNRGPMRGMIELGNWGRFKTNQDITALIPQCFLAYATGAWLDLHAADILLTRKPALQATGKVIFSRHKAAGNLKIPANRLIRTKPDGLGEIYRFVTTAEVVMPENALSVEAPVIAESYGQASNVTPGGICEIVTAIGGIDAVTNEPGWLLTEGADEETDDSLRYRCFLQWKSISGLNKYFYESLAYSVPGVADVKVNDQHPRGQGTLDVIIKGAAGMPTASLIEQVAAVIEANRPQIGDFKVLSPKPINAIIKIVLYIIDGNHETIKAEVENRLRALFTRPTRDLTTLLLKIAEDLTLSRIIFEAMKTRGVKSVDIISPSVDLVVPADGLAILQSLDISTVAAQA